MQLDQIAHGIERLSEKEIRALFSKATGTQFLYLSGEKLRAAVFAVIDQAVTEEELSLGRRTGKTVTTGMLRRRDVILDARQSGVYIIAFGDTLSELAEEFQIEMQWLAKGNKITNPGMIVAGERLHVPYPDEDADMFLRRMENW